MKLTNLTEDSDHRFREIAINCQQFIEEAGDQPMIKSCSNQYPDIHRVKVRKRKNNDEFTQTFNEAFYEQYPSVRQRSIIINNSVGDGLEPFYVFPTDGFKFMYAPNITESDTQYRSTFDNITSSMPYHGKELFQEVLTYTYINDSIKKAITETAEIIIYNIPFFYVVRCNIKYDKLMEYVK